MESRKIVLLLIALAIAGGTAMMARNVMQSAPQVQQAVVVEKPVVIEVLSAARDLPAGTIIKDVDVKWVAPSSGTTPTEKEFQKSKTEPSAYVGGVVRRGFRMGESLTSDLVVPKGDQGFMAAVLNPGTRAVSVPLTPVGGVAGFIFPGDHVDVIVTHKLGSKSEVQQTQSHRVSETLLTDVRVLALDQRADDQAAEPKVAQTATLEVSPKQAESLALISEIGQISLALRPQQQGNAPEAPALAEQVPSITEPQPTNMTWDSDISQVLEKPSNRHGVVQRIQIMRGKETTESVFDLKQ